MEEFPIKNSIYFKLFFLEKEEIMKLKWIESEKAGKDIGIDHAFFIWNTQHRILWINSITGNLIK